MQMVNHNLLNIHNYPVFLPESEKRMHKQVFERLNRYQQKNPERILVAGFNHPRNTSQDYGLSDSFAGDVQKFVRAYRDGEEGV